MARDGSGTFTFVEADFVSGSTIETAKVNSKFDETETALTASLAKDGQTTPTANLPMGAFKHTGVADGSSRTDYASLGQVAKGSYLYAIDTGTATAYASAPSPGIAAYVVGYLARFKAVNANTTTTPTLAVNGLAAGTITWPDGNALRVGDIPANAFVECICTSTTPTWHLQTVSKAPATIGANGTAPFAWSAATGGIRFAAAFNSTIYGMTYQNAAGDVTNDLDIAAGGCLDATGVYPIVLAALTKQLDAAWAVGSAAGGLDTGSIGNSDYYIWAIARSDTHVTDALYSLSSTAPTMPANYDYKRLIGWFKRVSAAIVPFKVYETAGGGLHLVWSTTTLDINVLNTLSNARRTDALKVPLNIATDANVRVNLSDGTDTFHAIVCSPDEADVAPSTTGAAAPLYNIVSTSALAGSEEFWMRTSATGTIAARVGEAITIDAYNAVTLGFKWSRRP